MSLAMICKGSLRGICPRIGFTSSVTFESRTCVHNIGKRTMATFRTSRAATARNANLAGAAVGVGSASGLSGRQLVLGGLAGAGIVTVGLMGGTLAAVEKYPLKQT
eukprot:gene4487-74_t